MLLCLLKIGLAYQLYAFFHTSLIPCYYFFPAPRVSSSHISAKCMPRSVKGRPIKNKLYHYLGNFSGKILASNNQRQWVIVLIYGQDSDSLALDPSSYESL